MNRLTARQRRNLGESLSGYSFILPQMLGFILFVLVPLVNVFIYSFQNKNMLFGTSTFCGLDNYEKLFSDPLFALTLKNTLIFSVFLVPLNLILAMAMALYLGDGRFGTRYIRTIIFLPVVTSGVAWAIVWKYLLQGGTAGRSTGSSRFSAFRGRTGSTKRAGPWLPSSSPACSKIWAQTC